MEAFETFARKICEYCMRVFFLPYLREHGVWQSYRAKVVSVDSGTKTMVVQRPFDNQVTLPYADSAANLTAGDQCVVVSLGESLNSVVIGDGNLHFAGGGSPVVAPKEIWYATCPTGANTYLKVATTLTGNFTLATGNMVRVTFTSGNTYNGTASLDVDNTGAVPIVRVGTTKSTRYYWVAGETVDFVYDGTNFAMSAKGTATTTYYGLTKLANTATSTSETLAITPNGVDLKIAAKVPDAPSTAGTYTLQCSVDSGGTATYSWV